MANLRKENKLKAIQRARWLLCFVAPPTLGLEQGIQDCGFGQFGICRRVQDARLTGTVTK